MNTRTARALLLAGTASAALILGACSSDKSEAKSAEAQIEDTVRAFGDAANDVDAEKFAAQVCAQYRDDYPIEELAQQLVFVKAFAGELSFEVTNIKVDGDTATGDLVAIAKNDDEPNAPESTNFVHEDGSWKICEPNEDMMS